MRKLTATLMMMGLASPVLAQTETLRTGVDPSAAPFAMTTLSGGLEGFTIDLLAAIGEEMGKTVDVTAMQYSGLFPAMQADNIDFVGAPTTATAERAESMLFTEGYINTDLQFLALKDGPDMSDIESFRGKTISVNKGTTYDSWAREQAETTGWIVSSYGTTNDAVSAVISGRSAAVLTNNTQAAWAAKQNPVLVPAYKHSTGNVFVMTFRQDSGELRDSVEMALECLKSKGEVNRIYETWFGVPAEEGSAITTISAGFGVEGLGGYDATEHKLNCM